MAILLCSILLQYNILSLFIVCQWILKDLKVYRTYIYLAVVIHALKYFLKECPYFHALLFKKDVLDQFFVRVHIYQDVVKKANIWKKPALEFISTHCLIFSTPKKCISACDQFFIYSFALYNGVKLSLESNVKFIYSEKATKFKTIYNFVGHYLSRNHICA